MNPIRQLFQVPVIALGVVFLFVGTVEWLLDDQKYWLILGLASTFVGIMLYLSRRKKQKQQQP
ncbi:MAG: LPXTG cell wall anchor domain-containing protein [Bacteroidetes bacterium]|nr:LPXTG cell wall anchor domain-containing protein [Bacteroidota bacterium]